jgi:hypothetical protein
VNWYLQDMCRILKIRRYGRRYTYSRRYGEDTQYSEGFVCERYGRRYGRDDTAKIQITVQWRFCERYGVEDTVFAKIRSKIQYSVISQESGSANVQCAPHLTNLRTIHGCRIGRLHAYKAH